MDPEYIKKIQEWVKIDNIILKNKEEVNKFSEEKKDEIDKFVQGKTPEVEDLLPKAKALEEDILQYVTANKLEKLTVNISDGKIKFHRKITQPSMSMKTISTILDSYTKSTKIDTKDILKYFQENAPKNESISIKRDLK